jgi:cobalt-zinc-cadmium efflux system membrane fusion protein
MTPSSRWFTALLLSLSPLLARADIPLSTAALVNLGIVLGNPVTAELAGALEARAQVLLPPEGEHLISAPVSGVVQRVYARSGDAVAQGDPLAELASAEFGLWQRDFLAAGAQQTQAQLQLERDRQLLEEGIIPQRRLDESTALAAAATATVRQAEQQLRLAGLDDASLRALQRSGTQQTTLLLRAPVDGVVLMAAASTGQRVDALEPVFRLGELGELWLQVQIPAERLGLVTLGQQLALSTRTSVPVAEITAVGQVVDPATQLASLRAKVSADAHDLRPGAFVSVRLLESATDTLAVPATALARSAEQTVVFVYDDGHFIPTEVSVVGSDGDLRLVRGALSAQSRIALRGSAALKALWLADED